MAEKSRCRKCFSLLNPKKIVFKDSSLVGYECKKCNEVFFDKELKTISLIKELKKKSLEARVGVLGNSFIMRIPAEYANAYGITKGKLLELVPTSETDFIVKLVSKEEKK